MGMKRLRPSPWSRLRSGWKAGIAAAVATLSSIGAALTFAGAANVNFGPLLMVVLSLIVILAGLGAAYIRGKSKLLPDSFVDEIGSERSYCAEFCRASILHEACDLTRDSYGHAYVSHDIAEQWRIRNPCAFVQIMNPENRLSACFGVLALQSSFMDQFIAGKVSDQQLGGEDVCTWNETAKCARLYLSGVVVRDPASYRGQKRARVMIWAILEYMKRLYDLKTPRQLYAVAVTREAGRLMKNLGFVVEMPAKLRTDGWDLYRYDLSEASWRSLLCQVGDFSLMCSINLLPPDHSNGYASAAPPLSTQGSVHPKTVLFVAGDRGGSQRNQVQIPREFTSIQDALRASTYRDAFSVAPPILAASRKALVEAYRHQPVILHFAGHGDDRSLSFILDHGPLVSQTGLLQEQLATILKNYPCRVSLCVLNTCNSAPIAEYLVKTNAVEAAVGWPARLADDAAIAFSGALYGRLGDGLGLDQAVTLASESCGSPDTPLHYGGVVWDLTSLLPNE